MFTTGHLSNEEQSLVFANTFWLIDQFVLKLQILVNILICLFIDQYLLGKTQKKLVFF